MWILIMVVLLVVVAAAIFLSGGIKTSGQFVCTLGQACKGNSDVEAQFQSDVGTPAVVTRSLNATTISAGDYVKVSLDVNVGAADFYSITENVPSGWVLVSPGTMTASTDGSYLSFVKLNGAVTTTHYYIVKAPDNPSQFYPVSGSFQYGKTFVQKYNEGFFVTGKSITGTQTISLSSSLIVTAPRGIYIDGALAGTGSVSKQIDPKTITLTFEDQPGYLKPSPKTVNILAGKKTTVVCTYQEKDPADSDSNGDVSTTEIGNAIQWFKTTQRDYAGNIYDITKLIYSVDRFYQGVRGGYYSDASQCTMTTA